MSNIHLTLHEQLKRVRPTIQTAAAPEPAAVREGRIRKESGEALPDRRHFNDPPENRMRRPYFCRSCGREEIAVAVPPGWYTIHRHTPDGSVRLGLYCSMKCFEEQLPRLRGIDKDLNSRGELG